MNQIHCYVYLKMVRKMMKNAVPSTVGMKAEPKQTTCLYFPLLEKHTLNLY